MNRRDRRAWRSAETLTDLGELTAQWCEGKLRETPYHLGPPDAETVPFLDLLAVVNRAGRFITTNSQAPPLPESRHNAWVEGFAALPDCASLAITASRAGLVNTALPLSAWDTVLGCYEYRCPRARPTLDSVYMIKIADPYDGRNDRLWPMLRQAFDPAWQ